MAAVFTYFRKLGLGSISAETLNFTQRFTYTFIIAHIIILDIIHYYHITELYLSHEVIKS